ncbi:MAG: L,D-transpeptidase family protein [Acidimicrobiaceae bacterium]|nr:L,D-transpeptidase family protein [Acidimicrobiaceae bacterium]
MTGVVVALTLGGPLEAGATHQAADGVLSGGEWLSAGESMSSPDGRYRLELRRRSGLVLYDTAGVSTADIAALFGVRAGHQAADLGFIANNFASVAVWSQHARGAADPMLEMRHDGNLVLLDANAPAAAPIWQTRTDGRPGAVANVRDDGTLAVGYAGGPVLWAAGTSTPGVGLSGVAHVAYGLSAQRVWLFEADGTLYDTYPVTGRHSLPGPGRYAVFSKSVRSRSLDGSLTMEHMVRFTHGRNGGAIGFHSIPRTLSGAPVQSIHDLGEPGSAGCVRQQDTKARQLFDWAAIGTPVVVIE